MTILLRPAHVDECSALTALCLRSKAHWGYEPAFMEACRDELTVTPEDTRAHLIVAQANGTHAGVAQVGPEGKDADILLLFIDPLFMGQGVGRHLFNWCVAEARTMGADRLMIDADPGAEAFYIKMDAKRLGESASGSIPGRVLPQLCYDLRA